MFNAFGEGYLSLEKNFVFTWDLLYETTTSQNVSSEAQVKNFFVS